MLGVAQPSRQTSKGEEYAARLAAIEAADAREDLGITGGQLRGAPTVGAEEEMVSGASSNAAGWFVPAAALGVGALFLLGR